MQEVRVVPHSFLVYYYHPAGEGEAASRPLPQVQVQEEVVVAVADLVEVAEVYSTPAGTARGYQK